MANLAPVEPDQLYPAFLEAFSDYAMDATGTTEASLRLRMQKNAVNYELSPGLYDGSRLVGFTLIGIDHWNGETTAFDAGTGIVPGFRKQGWAKRMFDHALPALRERGVKRFALEVLKENEPAIHAYRNSGFTVSRQLICYVCVAAVLRAAARPRRDTIHPIDRCTFDRLCDSADWVPSFENRFAAIDALPDIQLHGAFDGRTCVGALAYSPQLNWLLTLVVARAHRRRGIGRLLLEHLGRRMANGVSHLTVQNVDRDDAGMQAFFEALGFSHLATQYEMIRPL